MRKFEFKSEVWRWPGVGGWYFVNVPDSISNVIRKKQGKGMIKIEAHLGKSSWKTALFPYRNPKGLFGYFISIKSVIRKKENIYERDTINIRFKII